MKRIIVAFIAGQVVQIVLHTVSMNLWEHRQIPFCIVGGLLFLFAVVSGAWASSASSDRLPERKSYTDFAQIPKKG